MILKSTDPNEIPDYTKSNSVEFNFFIHFKVFFSKSDAVQSVYECVWMINPPEDQLAPCEEVIATFVWMQNLKCERTCA